MATSESQARSTLAEADVLVRGLLVIVIDTDGTSNNLNVSDGDGRSGCQVNSSVASTLRGHIYLDVGQMASLRGGPVKSSKLSRAINRCGINYDVLNGNKKDSSRIPSFGITAIDNRPTAEVSARLDDGRILRIAHEDGADSKI